MQGLQVFDSNGSCILDVTDRLTRVLGIFNTGTSNGSFVDPNLTSGDFWYAVSASSLSNQSPFWACLSVTVSGTTLSWEHIKTYDQGVVCNHQVIYGVY